MYYYEHENLQSVFSELISAHASPDGWEWLTGRSANGLTETLAAAFALVPRKTGRRLIIPTESQANKIEAFRPGLDLNGWTTDRLARVWLLLQLPVTDKDDYFRTIDALFRDAAVNEQVALYSALPVLAFPEVWVNRCSEGIRNNISDVLEAVMCNNPYPSENLDEAAWNQLVLKAFFTEKPIDRIIGLDKRTNLHLANTLSDYAHERWSAHRAVNPQLWRCVGLFINKDLFENILRLEKTGDPRDLEAAALACSASSYSEAQDWLDQHKELKTAIESGNLSWKKMSDKSSEYVLQ
jgi:hypothetical protein